MPAPVIGGIKDFGASAYGNASIDNTSPLATGLGFCVVFPLAGARDLTGMSVPQSSGGGPDTTVPSSRHGRSSNTGTSFTWTRSSNDEFCGDVSVMLLGARTVGGAGSYLSLGNSAASSTNLPLGINLGTSTGSIRRSSASSTAAVLLANASASGGVWHAVFSVPLDWTTRPMEWMRVTGNSTLFQTANGNADITPTTGGLNTIILQRPNGSIGWIAVALWSRCLTRAEMAALLANPFCFLKV